MKVIKKYVNRKLYDVETSKYVTVTSLLAMPVGSFVVLDYKTKEDITDETLFSGLSSYFSSHPNTFKLERDQLIAKVALSIGVPNENS